MIVIRAVANVPITLTGISPTGSNVILRRVGQHYSISNRIFDGSSAALSMLETKRVAGDIQIIVDGEVIVTKSKLQEAGYVSQRGFSWQQPHSTHIDDTNFIEVHEWMDAFGQIRRKTGTPPASDSDGYPVTCCASGNDQITVGDGAQYAKDDLKAAIIAIIGAAASDPVTVALGPGSFSVDNPVTLKNFVSIQGRGPGVTRLIALNPASPMFIDAAMNNWGQVSDLSIEDGTIGIDQQAASTLEITNVKFIDQTTGAIKQSVAANLMVAKNCAIESAVATGSLVDVGAGTFISFDLSVLKTANTCNDAVIASSGAIANLAGFTSVKKTGGTLTNGIQADQGTIRLRGRSTIEGADSGIKLTDTASSMILGSGPDISGSTTYDIDFTNGDASVAICAINSGSWDREKIRGNPAGFRSANNDVTVGREVKEETQGISIGRPGRGRASYQGEGRPYTTGMSVYQNDNLEAGVWTDITADAVNHTPASTTPLLGALILNTTVFIGGDRQFLGIDIKVDTALVLGGGAIGVRFWDGAVWVDIPFSVRKLSVPYNRRRNVPFQSVEIQSILFDPAIVATWVTKALDGNTKYWIMVYVSAGPITTDAVINWIDLHPNSARYDIDGPVEYIGLGRRSFRLELPVARIPGANAPSNAAIIVSANITFDDICDHPDAADTYVSYEMMIESWMDTSSPIRPSIVWKRTLAGAGNADWKLTTALILSDDTEAVGHIDANQTKTTAAPAVDLRQVTAFDAIDISSLVPGDRVVFKLERLGSTDTLGVSVYRREFFVEMREAYRGE